MTVSKELSPRIERAFTDVDRWYFMPENLRYLTNHDSPFPIGYGQTISQPSTVKNMLFWLAPEEGQTILDLGSGSGWSTALLASLVGPKGRVYGVEKIPQLKCFGENNCRTFGCNNVQFFLAEQQIGLAIKAPFDRILVSAAADGEIPKDLISQLAPGGKLVIPVNNSVFELHKDKYGDIAYCHEHFGYVFVPLVLSPDEQEL